MPVSAGAVLRARLPFIAAVCLTLLLVLSHSGLAAEKDDEKKEAAQGIRYDVKLEGVSDKGLRRDLEAVLDTKTYRDRPPAALVLLERRAEEDIVHLRDALRSLGYYDHEVSYALGEEKERALVTFHVRPGEAYRFGSVSATGEPAELAGTLSTPSLLGFRTGDRATSRAVVAGEERLVAEMKKAGYAFAAVSDKKVIVDHASKTVAVAYVLIPGPVARFGPTTFTGLESVREDYPRRLIPWKTGERYDGRLVDKLQKDLVQTRLFGLVRVIPAERLTPEGLLPMVVELKERKQRTVKVGANYQTDVGAGGKVDWEHRNLFHQGENLALSLQVSEITYSAGGTFRKPAFLERNQSLVVDSRIAREEFDAYTSNFYESSVLLERVLIERTEADARPGQTQDETLSVGAGPALRLAKVKATDEYIGFPIFQDDTFLLLGLRSYLRWNTTDDLLNPTKGGRLLVEANPYYEVFNTGPFLKAFASYSHYFRILAEPQLILANRVAMGSIVGAERNDIPADVRFYAGGGGSIRGYPFQKVGPLFRDEPTGGKSILEFSTEFRLKVTDTIGMVAFLDGGSAFESSYPDFGSDIRLGAGTGIRYFTPVGPLRLDIAFPLQRRPDVDSAYQIYVGIGQAF